VNYAEQQRNPSKHMVGLGVVIVMHIILGWALLNGLARKVVEVVKGPIETKIIEEVKPPPPPPPENLPPPPKLPPPPPAYMPPPEIRIETPPPPAPTITVQTTPPPPAPPVAIAPPAPPEAPPAPPAPAAPARVAPQVNFNTDCEKPSYPPAAARAEAMGVVRIKVTVGTDGRATATEIAKSSGPSREHKLLDRAAEAAIKNTCKFKPGTVDGKPETLTTFVEYDWKLN
jgi:protein TonB